jgi:transposase InsO family protein
MKNMNVSERRACKVVEQPVSTQRHVPVGKGDEKALTARIIELATQYGRYGYRRITALLCNEGWIVNHKRVERIWRREGLKVPKKQSKRKRLWLDESSCVRLRPRYRNHVWSYDFVMTRTHDGRTVKILTLMDEYSRECLALKVGRNLTSQDVIEQLATLFIVRGLPEHIRSDNGPEFTAKAVRHWLQKLGVQTLFIEPGSPWENGYIESFNGKLRDELLNREIFTTLLEAQVLTKWWKNEYNHVRPHSSLGYRTPVPESYKSVIQSNLTSMRH